MRIFTVTCGGRAAAMVRAADSEDAIAQALKLAAEEGLSALGNGRLEAREPNDAEMVSWLELRSDHLVEEENSTRMAPAS